MDNEKFQTQVPYQITNYQENIEGMAEKFIEKLKQYSNGQGSLERNAEEVYSNFMAMVTNLENVKKGLVRNFNGLLDNSELASVINMYNRDESSSLENLVFSEDGNLKWVGETDEPEFVSELRSLISSTYEEKAKLEEQVGSYEEENQKLREKARDYETRLNQQQFELDELKQEYEDSEEKWQQRESEYQNRINELEKQLASYKENSGRSSQNKTDENEISSELVDSETKQELFSAYRDIIKEKSSRNLDERTIKLGDMLGELTLEYKRLKQEYEHSLEKLEQVVGTRDELYRQRSQLLKSYRDLVRRNKKLEEEQKVAKGSLNELGDELDNYKRRLEGSNRLLSDSEGQLEKLRQRAHQAELNYDEALHENIELDEIISSMRDYVQNLEENNRMLSKNYAQTLSKLDDTENFLEATNRKAQGAKLISTLKDVLAKKLGNDLNQKEVLLENTYQSLESTQEQKKREEERAQIIEAEYKEILDKKDRELQKNVEYVKALEAGQKDVMDRLKKLEKPLKNQFKSIESGEG